ncbi:fibronectin type III domain-containing protein [Blastococcus sp. SYSU DS0669]
MAGGLAVVTAAGVLATLSGVASAGTPPAGPGNIEVFPDRDMIAIEGYTAQAGQTANITVRRGGQVVGTASGEVDATGFREWNHDSASCFTDVTPDLQAGDEVSLSFSASPLVDGMQVSSAQITEVIASEPAEGNVNSVTYNGTYGSDVSLDRFAVEVVNPTMRDEGAIGERAIGWSPNEVPDEAPTGYTVSGTAENGVFSVTFADMSASDQQLVYEGQAVALSWMADATTVEQQLGLTLAEYGLASGGAPGCPAGPDGARPPVSEYSTVWNADGTSATVTWASATPVLGGDAVTGYSVTAVDQTTQRQEGYRVGANATQVVLDGLTSGALYDIEVRSMVGNEMGAPFALAGTIAPPNEDGSADTTAPVVTTTPALTGTTAVETASLTLATDEGTLYYTTDGSLVTTVEGGNVPSATATLYTAPIPVTTANTTVNYVAIDAAGNATHGSGVVSPAPAAAAVAPTGLAITGFNGSGVNNDAGRVRLAWNPVTDATEYRVRVSLRTDATATTSATVVLQPERDVVVTGTTAEVTGLPKSEPGTRWVFRVQSKTPAATTYSSLSPGVNVVLPGDDVAIGLAQFRTGDEFRIDGSGTVPGATITVHRTNTAGTGPALNPIAGYPTGVVGPIEAPEASGAWAITVDPAPATAPTEIWVKSSEGGVSGPFPVEVR